MPSCVQVSVAADVSSVFWRNIEVGNPTWDKTCKSAEDMRLV